MTVLVVYGSRYGATRGIAERVAATLRAAGRDTDLREATPLIEAHPYDAFVIGSAAYQGSWLKGPAEFVLRHVDLLSMRPVWLFSSGPLGTSATDDQGRDLLELTRPRQFLEFEEALAPRDMRVFSGALYPDRLTLVDRVLRWMPSGRQLLPAGDYRDWPAIEAWAREIAAQLPTTAA